MTIRSTFNESARREIWSIRHPSQVLFPCCIRAQPFLARLSGRSSHVVESGTGFFGQRVCPNLDHFRVMSKMIGRKMRMVSPQDSALKCIAPATRLFIINTLW
jgi:hypothetical protein